MSQDTTQDTGLIRRGLFLMFLVGGIVAVVLWIIFQRPAQQVPPTAKQPEPYLAVLATPALGYPGSVAWTSMAMLTDRLPSSPGWEVRYNASTALARLGSDEVAWSELADMLDEDQQMRNFRVRLETGQIVPDEAAARLTVLASLKAVQQWHEKKSGSITPTPEMTRVYQAVDRLAQSPVAELKKQAEETRSTIGAKKAG